MVKSRPMIFPDGTHQIVLFSGQDTPIAFPRKIEINFLSPKSELVFPGDFVSQEIKSPKIDFSLPGKLSFLPKFVDFKQRFDRPIYSQILGLIIFLASFIGISLTIGPMVAAEAAYQINRIKREVVRIVKHQPVKPKRVYVTDSFASLQFEDVPKPIDPNFSVVIPKIGLNVKVTPNVNTSREKDYLPVLKSSVAHAAGTALPNEEGVGLVFGHSALTPKDIIRYNAVFYQIKDLEVGDEVNVFYDSRRYFYKVTEKRIVNPAQTEFLDDHSPGRTLVLQTCWPLGTTKQRLLVFARPVGAEAKSDLAKPVGFTGTTL